MHAYIIHMESGLAKQVYLDLNKLDMWSESIDLIKIDDQSQSVRRVIWLVNAQNQLAKRISL